MHANVPETSFPDEAPTRPINDGPTLIRIRRLAALARERLSLLPDANAVALAAREVEAIEAMAIEALR
ncbi:MAG TPA: hypothetical protein VGM06_25465 [Polyangiaceae bacterium]|jgi:hypothetical protein